MEHAFPNTSISRRQFIATFSASVATSGVGAFVLNGCKSTSVPATPAATSENLAAARDPNPAPDLQKQRAFMVVWLLVTTNPKVLSVACHLDYQAVSDAVNGHLSSTDVSTIFQSLQGNLATFNTVAKAFDKVDSANPLHTADCSALVPLIKNLADPAKPMDKHRALLTTWLLVTTNGHWQSTDCHINFDNIAQALGGQIKGSDVRRTFSTMQNDADSFGTVSALFNGSLKTISGFAIPFYQGKECPPHVGDVINLLKSDVSGTLEEPTGCPVDPRALDVK